MAPDAARWIVVKPLPANRAGLIGDLRDTKLIVEALVARFARADGEARGAIAFLTELLRIEQALHGPHRYLGHRTEAERRAYLLPPEASAAGVVERNAQRVATAWALVMRVLDGIETQRRAGEALDADALRAEADARLTRRMLEGFLAVANIRVGRGAGVVQ